MELNAVIIGLTHEVRSLVLSLGARICIPCAHTARCHGVGQLDREGSEIFLGL